MNFSIYSDGVFYVNYHTNTEAAHNAFQSYRFITLSKIWSQFFLHLYSSASGIRVSKPKQDAVFIILGQLKKSKLTHLFRFCAGSRRHPHLLSAPYGKKTDFHKQSSKADNYSVCLRRSHSQWYWRFARLYVNNQTTEPRSKCEFWHHILDHHILKYDV